MTDMPATSIGGQDGPRRKRRIFPWLVSGAVVCFSLGLIGSPWFDTTFRQILPAALQREAPASHLEVEQLQARLESLEAQQKSLAHQMPALNSPSAQLPVEARIEQLEAKTNSHASEDLAIGQQLSNVEAQLAMLANEAANSNRLLQDLYLLSVARRMVEAGRPLTPLTPAFEARFQADHGPEVTALLNWSREPQTWLSLYDRLPLLGTNPAPTASVEQGLWAKLRAHFENIRFVREAGSSVQSQQDEIREAAQKAMRDKDLRQAMNLVATLEATDKQQWLNDARLVQDAADALDKLDLITLDQLVAHMRKTSELPN